MLNNNNINIYERRAIYIEYPGYSTGCPTKHDSWRIVFNVFFHDTVLVIVDFLQFISLNNLYSNIYLFENNFTKILLPFSISSSLVSNYLTNNGEDIFNYSPNVMFRGTPCIYEKNISVTVFSRL